MLRLKLRRKQLLSVFSNSTTVLRIPAKKICMQLFECAASAHKSRTIFSKDALSIVTNFIQNRWTISSIAVPFSLRHKMKGKKTSKPNCLDIKRKVYIVSWYYSVRLFSEKKIPHYFDIFLGINSPFLIGFGRKKYNQFERNKSIQLAIILKEIIKCCVFMVATNNWRFHVKRIIFVYWMDF